MLCELSPSWLKLFRLFVSFPSGQLFSAYEIVTTNSKQDVLKQSMANTLRKLFSFSRLSFLSLSRSAFSRHRVRNAFGGGRRRTHPPGPRQKICVTVMIVGARRLGEASSQTQISFHKVQISFRNVQIFISQTQIFISQRTDFISQSTDF